MLKSMWNFELAKIIRVLGFLGIWAAAFAFVAVAINMFSNNTRSLIAQICFGLSSGFFGAAGVHVFASYLYTRSPKSIASEFFAFFKKEGWIMTAVFLFSLVVLVVYTAGFILTPIFFKGFGAPLGISVAAGGLLFGDFTMRFIDHQLDLARQADEKKRSSP